MKRVVITDLRTVEMREARQDLAQRGYEVLTVPPEIRLWEEEPLRRFAEACGELDGVIHPAPPLFRRPLEAAREDEFAAARDEGALAAWCVTKAFGDRLRKQGRGSLIYVNSVHAEKPVGEGFLFSAGCGAVQMLSREVSQDYGPHGVNSFFIQRGPGREDPDGRSDVSHFYYGADLRYPLRRFPDPGNLNGLLAFLLTPEAGILSGSDLRADGGMTLYYGERAEEPAPAVELKRIPWSPEAKDPEGEDRVAVVTGSGKGVGAGIVRVLAKAGIRCVINCNSNRALAEKTLAEIREMGGEALIAQADVSDPAQCESLVRAAVERYGRLDILVNNAAMQYNRFVDQYDAPLLRSLWDVNVGGYWRMIKYALPALRKSPRGRIVNIGSVHGKRPTCFDAGYAMTKGAVRMLTREAALELHADGIPVNSVTLGGCWIEFKTGTPPFPNRRPPEVSNPSMRIGRGLVQPEEVGELVRWLVTEAPEAMTGDAVRIDCGQMLW